MDQWKHLVLRRCPHESWVSEEQVPATSHFLISASFSCLCSLDTYCVIGIICLFPTKTQQRYLSLSARGQRTQQWWEVASPHVELPVCPPWRYGSDQCLL